MKNAGLPSQESNGKAQLEKDIEDLRSKMSKTESDFTNEKNRLQTEIGKLKDLNTKLEADKSSLNSQLKALETDSTKAANETKSLIEEKKKLESQIAKLNADLSKSLVISHCDNIQLNYCADCLIILLCGYEKILTVFFITEKSSTQQTAMSDCMKKIEDLKKEMDTKDKEIEKLKKQVETLTKSEQDKSKMIKEVSFPYMWLINRYNKLCFINRNLNGIIYM